MTVAQIPLPDDPGGVRFEDLPGDTWWPRYELIDGSLYVTPLAAPDHQLIVMNLCLALTAHAPDEHTILPGVNIVRRSETDRTLIPDVAVVERTGLMTAREKRVSYVLPEDVFLAVEVISPSSRAMDLGTKRDLYAEWKTPIYWVLDPKSHEIHEFGLLERRQSWLADVDLSGIWPD